MLGNLELNDQNYHRNPNALKNVFLFAFTLCIIIAICCHYHEKRTAASNSPVSRQILQDALTATGLSWEVAGEEQLREGHMVYELVNREGKSISVVSNVADSSKRILQINFLSSSEISALLPSEDWEKAVRLATILYGNFDSDDQVYRNFLDTYEELMIIDDVPEDAAKRKRIRWSNDINGIRCFLGFRQEKSDLDFRFDFAEAEFVSIVFSDLVS